MCDMHGHGCATGSHAHKDKLIAQLFEALEDIAMAIEDGEIPKAEEICLSWLTPGS